MKKLASAITWEDNLRVELGRYGSARDQGRSRSADATDSPWLLIKSGDSRHLRSLKEVMDRRDDGSKDVTICAKE
jgi:hypothetical protein